MVTINELKEYNKKIDTLKTQHSQALAEVKVLEGQLNSKMKELSETLGIEVTADNIETLYNQAVEAISEKVASIQSLLADLTNNGVNTAEQKQTTVPNMFKQMMQQSTPNRAAVQPQPMQQLNNTNASMQTVQQLGQTSNVLGQSQTGVAQMAQQEQVVQPTQQPVQQQTQPFNPFALSDDQQSGLQNVMSDQRFNLFSQEESQALNSEKSKINLFSMDPNQTSFTI